MDNVECFLFVLMRGIGCEGTPTLYCLFENLQSGV